MGDAKIMRLCKKLCEHLRYEGIERVPQEILLWACVVCETRFGERTYAGVIEILQAAIVNRSDYTSMKRDLYIT